MLIQSFFISLTRCQFDHTVASVAPPSATTSAPTYLSFTASTSPNGTQSPLSNTSRTPDLRCSPLPHTPATCCNAAGAESHIVILSSSNRRASSFGSAISSSPAISTTPPAASTPKMSYTERSKHNDVTNSIRSALPTPNSPFIHSIKFTTDRCLTITPFGRPLDPDV